MDDDAPWTMEELAALAGWELPSVRVRVERDEWPADRWGRICRDGGDGRPWVEVWEDGELRAEPSDWGTILSALNDRFAPAVWFPKKEGVPDGR